MGVGLEPPSPKPIPASATVHKPGASKQRPELQKVWAWGAEEGGMGGWSGIWASDGFATVGRLEFEMTWALWDSRGWALNSGPGCCSRTQESA